MNNDTCMCVTHVYAAYMYINVFTASTHVYVDAMHMHYAVKSDYSH